MLTFSRIDFREVRVFDNNLKCKFLVHLFNEIQYYFISLHYRETDICQMKYRPQPTDFPEIACQTLQVSCME